MPHVTNFKVPLNLLVAWMQNKYLLLFQVIAINFRQQSMGAESTNRTAAKDGERWATLHPARRTERVHWKMHDLLKLHL